MKPFDIEKALEGHPVCYSDGSMVEELIVLPEWVDFTHKVFTKYKQTFFSHTLKGYYLGEGEGHLRDLFLTETKKEGWVNLYRGTRGTRYAGGLYQSESEAKDEIDDVEAYITTIKIEWEE